MMEVQNYNSENFNDYNNGNYNDYTEEGEYEEPYNQGEEYGETVDSTENQEQKSPSSRERDRDRERRRRHWDRKERRSGDKDRHERRRSRDRDRDRRDRERRHRDRDRSSHREDRYDDDNVSNDSEGFRDYRNMDDRGGEKWMTDTPTNTVLLRGLPQSIDESDIRGELMMFGTPVKDVRLMRRSSGASRGFAFVEFQSIADAQRWMDQNQVENLALS